MTRSHPPAPRPNGRAPESRFREYEDLRLPVPHLRIESLVGEADDGEPDAPTGQDSVPALRVQAPELPLPSSPRAPSEATDSSGTGDLR